MKSINKVQRLALIGLLSSSVFAFESGMAKDDSYIKNLVLEPVLLSQINNFPNNLSTIVEDEQSVNNDDLVDSIKQYQSSIITLKQEQSSSAELIKEISLLGLTYQKLEQHEEAIETFKEAISFAIESADGESTSNQIPLQEQIIHSYLALNDLKSVDKAQEIIYTLYQDNYEVLDPEMYLATINLADWNLQAYFKENYMLDNKGLKLQQKVLLRTEYAITANVYTLITSGTVNDQDVYDPRLKKVSRLYTDYQDELYKAGNAPIDIIIDLAKRSAGLAYFGKQEMDYERYNRASNPNYYGSREQIIRNSSDRLNGSYVSGRDYIEYAINTLRSVEDVPKELLATSLIELGDWHLAYGKSKSAEEAYGDAYQVLIDSGFSEKDIDTALSVSVNEKPINIPSIATHAFTRESSGVPLDKDLGFDGYFDYSYTVSSLGNVENIELIGSSQEAALNIESKIRGQLRSAKYRPTLKGGELVGQDQVEVRYFYSY